MDRFPYRGRAGRAGDGRAGAGRAGDGRAGDEPLDDPGHRWWQDVDTRSGSAEWDDPWSGGQRSGGGRQSEDRWVPVDDADRYFDDDNDGAGSYPAVVDGSSGAFSRGDDSPQDAAPGDDVHDIMSPGGMARARRSPASMTRGGAARGGAARGGNPLGAPEDGDLQGHLDRPGQRDRGHAGWGDATHSDEGRGTATRPGDYDNGIDDDDGIDSDDGIDDDNGDWSPTQSRVRLSRQPTPQGDRVLPAGPGVVSGGWIAGDRARLRSGRQVIGRGRAAARPARDSNTDASYAAAAATAGGADRTGGVASMVGTAGARGAAGPMSLAGQSVIKMLWPQRALVPFDDTDGHLADLQRWVAGDEAESVRTIIGPAGSGKTRLAFELARLLTQQGWLVSFYPATEGWDEQELAELAATRRPHLVIIDNSDLRPSEVQLVAESMTGEAAGTERFGDGPELRLLLLARSDAAYTSAEPLAGELLDGGEPRYLRRSFLSSLHDRQAHFRRAFAAFVSHFGYALQVSPAEIEPPSVEDERFTLPLFLQMSAVIAAVSAIFPDETELPYQSADHLIGRIVDLEDRQYWRYNECPQWLRGLDHMTSERRQLVALASLLPAYDDTEQSEVVKRVRTTEVESICDWVWGLYRDAGLGFQRMQPALVGEYLVARYGGRRDIEASVNWGSRGESLATAANALNLIQATLNDFSSDATRIRPWLAEHLRTSWAIIQEAANDPDVFGAAELGAYADAVTNLINTDPLLARSAPSMTPDLPMPMIRLSAALKEHSVANLTDLAERYPERYQPDLATALNNLGIRYSSIGRYDDALDATLAAVQLYDQLGLQYPRRFDANRASAYNNLGVRYSDMGHFRDAVEATQIAVDIRSQLAERQPDRYSHSLAGALSNLGSRYREFGDYDGALDPTHRAVDMYADMIAEDPYQYSEPLAAELHNLAVSYSRLGYYAEAYGPAKEAVDLYTYLTKSNSKRYEQDLVDAIQLLHTIRRSSGYDSRDIRMDQVIARRPPQNSFTPAALSRDGAGFGYAQGGQLSPRAAARLSALHLRQPLEETGYPSLGDDTGRVPTVGSPEFEAEYGDSLRLLGHSAAGQRDNTFNGDVDVDTAQGDSRRRRGPGESAYDAFDRIDGQRDVAVAGNGASDVDGGGDADAGHDGDDDRGIFKRLSTSLPGFRSRRRSRGDSDASDAHDPDGTGDH